MSDAASYLVCGVPRSGSSALCEALRAAAIAGLPREYFMPSFPGSETIDVGVAGFEASPWARERGLDTFPDFLAGILQEGRTRNGVFGASLQWSSFEPLLEKLRIFTPYGGTATIPRLLRRSFGQTRFIYLTRRDRVRQAVSWALAHQTGCYTSTQVTRHAALAQPRFDSELLDGLMRRIEEAAAGWESLFDLLEVEPLRLSYEDWTQDLPGTVDEILRWLDIPTSGAPFVLDGLSLERQATSLNDEWAARYRALATAGASTSGGSSL